MKPKFLVTCCALLATYLANAQGLYVQPASYEMPVKAGTSYDLPLVIRNNQSDLADGVEVTGLYLTQSLSGFEGVEQEKMTPEILKAFPSCLAWIKLPTQTKFSLAPLAQQSLTVRLDVPASAHGFYGAVVVVASQRPQSGPGLKLVLRFVIPILIHVDSGVSRKGGQVQDAAAMFVPAEKSHPAGTMVACMIRNSGDTIARYSGSANVFQLVNGRKRRVIAATFEDRRIIPNATVALTFQSPNRLPSGTYRIEAAMSMEGQKLPPFAKEVEVRGDPSVTSAVADVELGLSPDPIEFDATPGATRGISFKVQNSGTDPIIIEAFVATPRSLQGATGPMGNGEDFSLVSWCPQPISGTLIGAGQERTLRILTNVPEGQLTRPVYFGELHVVAKTQDGVIVGNGTLLMIGKNKLMKSAPAIAAGSDIVIASVKPKVYAFTSSFSNAGNGDIQPNYEARITDTARINTVMALGVVELPKRLLPLETIRPSGQIDVSLIKDGTYILEVTVTAGEVRQVKTAGIKVTTVGGVKKLTLVAVPKTAGKPKTGGG